MPLTLQKTIEEVLNTIREVVPFELAMIFILEKNNLKALYSKGAFAIPALKDYQISLADNSYLVKLLKSNEIHISDNKNLAWLRRDIVKIPNNYLCIVAPLYIDGKILGALTLDYSSKSFDTSMLKMIKGLVKLITLAIRQSKITNNVLSEKNTQSKHNNLEIQNPNLIGESPKWLEVLEKIKLVATTNARVMITGETGTGKEQVAKQIHSLSLRANHPFIALNCSSLIEDIATSELFGHERGAFTSAISKRRGRFELANNGTLFLDEVGELPLSIQPQFLRALEEGCFERVGGEQTVHSNARIICATNIDIETAIKKNLFRKDLFYRLNVFPIQLPSLQERGNDVIKLAQHFVDSIAKEYGRPKCNLSERTMDFLLHHSWPGNVRELKNKIERAFILAKNTIEPEHFIDFDTKTTSICQRPQAENSICQRTQAENKELTFDLNSVIKDHIIKALKKCDGRVYGENGAAMLLNLKPTTLQSKMRKLNIVAKCIKQMTNIRNNFCVAFSAFHFEFAMILL